VAEDSEVNDLVNGQTFYTDITYTYIKQHRYSHTAHLHHNFQLYFFPITPFPFIHYLNVIQIKVKERRVWQHCYFAWERQNWYLV